MKRKERGDKGEEPSCVPVRSFRNFFSFVSSENIRAFLQIFSFFAWFALREKKRGGMERGESIGPTSVGGMIPEV